MNKHKVMRRFYSFLSSFRGRVCLQNKGDTNPSVDFFHRQPISIKSWKKQFTHGGDKDSVTLPVFYLFLCMPHLSLGPC